MVSNPSVHLDSCCFIEMVKANVATINDPARRADVWYLKKILEANQAGDLRVYTSTLSMAECLHVGSPENVTKQVMDDFRALLNSGQYLTLVQMTPFIADQARDLLWKHQIKLRGADAIHVASALEMGAVEMLSLDTRLEKKATYAGRLDKLGLSVKSPANTTVLPSRYLQLDIEKANEAH